MAQDSRPGRSLLIELAARTAVVDGQRVELPPTEFTLLAALAARPGELMSSQELLALAFPESSWVTPEDLHQRIWKIRKLIGDRDSEQRILRNRRNAGYFIDLPPASVQVVPGLSTEAQETEAIHLDESRGESKAIESLETSTGAPALEFSEVEEKRGVPQASQKRPRARILPVLATAAVVAALFAVSWGAGYWLSQRRAPVAAALRDEPPSEVTDEPRQEPENGARKKSGETKPGSRDSRAQKDNGGGIPGAAAPAGDNSGAGANSTSRLSDSQARGRTTAQNKKEAPPPLPPAPTRYLYHLINEKTGDHFVTTDSATASEQEARGYQGGAIARIYTYQEDRTKAITTNGGIAYVFVGAAPKTEPASRTVALWYSTDNDGDFFYTTSESEAKQSGWTGSLVGYVRAL